MTHAILSHVQNCVVVSKLYIIYIFFLSILFFSTNNTSMYSMPNSVSLYISSSISNPFNDLSFVTGNFILIS